MELLLSIGFSITGFSAVYLLLNRQGERQSKYALLLLLLWFARFLSLFFKSTLELEHFPFLILFDQNLFFLDGVLLYWYISSFRKPISRRGKFLHSIPFLIALGGSLLTYIMIDSRKLVSQYREQIEGEYNTATPEVIFIILVIAFNTYFFVKSFGLIKKYDYFLLDNLSNLLKMQVNWLRRLTYFWMVFLLIPLVLFFLNYLASFESAKVFEGVYFAGMLITAVFFAMNVIAQRYPKNVELDKTDEPNQKETGNEQEIVEAFELLSNYMEKHQPYKDEQLTLSALAEQIGIKPSRLSIAINRRNKTNFYEFVNTYRVEAVKNELVSTNEQVIIIAYRNGFNSKSTFNNVFKKMTGLTPTAYRKQSKLPK